MSRMRVDLIVYSYQLQFPRADTIMRTSKVAAAWRELWKVH
jgi:hypothetical protein